MKLVFDSLFMQVYIGPTALMTFGFEPGRIRHKRDFRVLGNEMTDLDTHVFDRLNETRHL